MTDCPEISWLPDPPMALGWAWPEWRDAALDWMAHQSEPWDATDMRAVLPEGRNNWPGAAIRTATARNMIRLVGQHRSTHPSRKGSLLAIWQTNKD